MSLNSCRDRRHEASTVGVTAMMASAVGAIKLRQSGIVPARSTSTSSFLLSSSLAVRVRKPLSLIVFQVHLQQRRNWVLQS